jgi:hypothetical protein
MGQKMSKILTYKGKLPVGEQEKIHLSTNNGLTGYQVKNFKIINSDPGVSSVDLVGKIYLTDQTGNISSTIDFSDSDLIATNYYIDKPSGNYGGYETIIFDKETFNQDIFVYITDAGGGSGEANFYIELEQFKIDINTSTYHTLKNIRSRTQ